jgi:3-methyladenine DNA glycosylase/8-oxoguanine DNA glycosylase
MARATITIRCPEFYDLYMTCHVHGWISLAPFAWAYEKHVLRFAALVDHQPVDGKVTQSDETVKATVSSHQKLTGASKSNARAMITRSLGMDHDTTALLNRARRIGPEFVRLIEKGAGRLLRAPTLWEDAAKTLFTTNCSWSLTQKICMAACSKTFSRPTPSGVFPFPSSEKIAGYSAGQLKQLMPVGYRAAYLKALAEAFTHASPFEAVEKNRCDYKAADKLFRQLKGFADYAAAHLLLLAGYYNEIPVDTVVVAYLKENHHVRKPKSFIDRHYRKWGKFKWWGYKLEKMLNHQNWLGD